MSIVRVFLGSSASSSSWRDDHVLVRRDLVALHDVLVGDLLAVGRADPLLLDPHPVGVVQLVEADGLLRNGAVELHGHVHEPEADGASPDRSSHVPSFIRHKSCYLRQSRGPATELSYKTGAGRGLIGGAMDENRVGKGCGLGRSVDPSRLRDTVGVCAGAEAWPLAKSGWAASERYTRVLRPPGWGCHTKRSHGPETSRITPSYLPGFRRPAPYRTSKLRPPETVPATWPVTRGPHPRRELAEPTRPRSRGPPPGRGRPRRRSPGSRSPRSRRRRRGARRARSDRSGRTRSLKSRASPRRSWMLSPRNATPRGPKRSQPSRSRGDSSRQGVHHEAHRLSTTGVPRSSEIDTFPSASAAPTRPRGAAGSVPRSSTSSVNAGARGARPSARAESIASLGALAGQPVDQQGDEQQREPEAAQRPQRPPAERERGRFHGQSLTHARRRYVIRRP